MTLNNQFLHQLAVLVLTSNNFASDMVFGLAHNIQKVTELLKNILVADLHFLHPTAINERTSVNPSRGEVIFMSFLKLRM